MPDVPVTVKYKNSSLECTPDPAQAHKGTDNIKFNRTPTNADWKLTNVSIWPSGGTQPSNPGTVSAPFTVASITDGLITVTDNNPGVADTDFNYQIYAQLADGTVVDHDPQILNKKG
jgi:hypothetical protein